MRAVPLVMLSWHGRGCLRAKLCMSWLVRLNSRIQRLHYGGNWQIKDGRKSALATHKSSFDLLLLLLLNDQTNEMVIKYMTLLLQFNDFCEFKSNENIISGNYLFFRCLHEVLNGVTIWLHNCFHNLNFLFSSSPSGGEYESEVLAISDDLRNRSREDSRGSTLFADSPEWTANWQFARGATGWGAESELMPPPSNLRTMA